MRGIVSGLEVLVEIEGETEVLDQRGEFEGCLCRVTFDELLFF